MNRTINNNKTFRKNSSRYNNALSSPQTNYGINILNVIILIIVLIAFIGSTYWLYNYYYKKTIIKYQDVEVLTNITDATNKKSIGSGVIPNSNYSNEYSISFWMNINDYNYNYGKEKVIMRRGASGSGNPEIVLDAKQNDLIVRIKLQAGTLPKISSSGVSSGVSSFADIPVELQNQTKQFIGKEEPYYTYDNFEQEIPKETSFKIGENIIDYPTVQYTMGTGLNSDIINNSLFLGHSDKPRVSSSSDYFSMISGNSINNTYSKKENFGDVEDASNLTVKILVDLCDIAKLFQGVDLANISVESLNKIFDIMVNTIEQTRAGTKTTDDINSTLENLITADFKAMIPDSTISIIKTKIIQLTENANALMEYQDVSIDVELLKKLINEKMKSINCPLTIEGINEVDNTISLYKNMVLLIKKTLFAFINNMGVGIRKIYPELAESICNDCNKNSVSNDNTVGTCVSKMVPLQKWVNVIVSVYNQIVDIYIDGQLTSSCVLKGFPDISTENVELTPDGGFSGSISRVKFMNTAMTVQNARRIYYEGPIKTENPLYIIPNWVWWTILIIIIIVLLYSFLV